jgi:hypothetical protein
MTMSNVTKATSQIPTSSDGRLQKFFARVDPQRARLIFALDATASRQPTWDRAAGLTAQMFEAVGTIGLDVQLLYYRGYNECVASRWLSDARALAATMARVTCAAGHTQIRRALAHARRENTREKVAALVTISDACEEAAHDLYAEARELGSVPVFMFQEGDEPHVSKVYAEIARITGGALASFDSNSAQRLADLLKAVAAFAAGGVKALGNQNTEAARLLLTQIRR